MRLSVFYKDKIIIQYIYYTITQNIILIYGFLIFVQMSFNSVVKDVCPFLDF